MSVQNVTLPAFNGLNDDCETFVSSIQQLALSKEKHTDDKWIAGLVAGCLCGDALVWFAALDPTTQESWHTLRRRLLERYGIKAFPRMSKNASRPKRHSRASSITSTSSDSSAYSTSSTSICSSPVIPAQKHYSPKNTSSGGRAGRIAVTCGGKGTRGYISRSPDRDGVYYVTPNASEALHVQVEPAKDSQLMEIRLLNSSVTQEHLGVTWYNSGNPDMRYGSSSISGLSATRVTPLVVESSASELYRGPESSTIWSLGEGDALEAKWPTGSGHAHTLVMAIGPGKVVYFVPDQCSWIEGSWFGRYVEARLTFEPFIRPLAHSRNSSTLSLPSPARLTAPKLNDGLNPKVRFLAAAQESVEWSSIPSSAPKPARFGRVRVISNHPAGNGYVGTTLSNSGALLVSHVDEDIPLEVRCPEGRGILHNLELVNAKTDHTWLGMTWLESKAPSLCPGSSSIAALSHVSDSRWGYSVSSTSNKYAGEKGHAVWNVHDDGTIRATWSDGIVSKSLSFVTDPASRELFVVPDKTSSWLGEFWGYVRVELMFESE